MKIIALNVECNIFFLVVRLSYCK